MWDFVTKVISLDRYSGDLQVNSHHINNIENELKIMKLIREIKAQESQ